MTKEPVDVDVANYVGLDMDAPSGRYEVDRIAISLKWNDNVEANFLSDREKVLMMRELVGSHGELAAHMAKSEASFGRTRQYAEDQLGLLKELRLAARRIGPTSWEETAHHFARPVIVPEMYSPGDGLRIDREMAEAGSAATDEAKQALDGISALASQLVKAIECFEASHRLGISINRGRRNVLAHQFAWHLKRAWSAVTGEPAPKSSDGPCQRFCLAAWVDLNMPADLSLKMVRALAEPPDDYPDPNIWFDSWSG